MNPMFSQILQRIISYGTEGETEQEHVNRIKRINLFYMIFFIILILSIIWAAISTKHILILLNTAMFLAGVAVFFIFPVKSKPGLNSMLVLGITGLLFLSGYLFNAGITGGLIFAFYLLFPLAAVSINAKNGIYVSVGLGLVTLLFNYVPLFEGSIHLDIFNTLVFFSAYTLVIIISRYAERSNRRLLASLNEAKNLYENQVVQKDEFISRLSYKLRTSLSNISLINNLVHDSRLSSEQMELVETLKASTNNLIEDVNNIVEIASPGIMDYKKSIISFDLNRVLEEAVSILNSEPNIREDVVIRRSDRVNHFLIGDPSLLKSLVVNIVKGLSIYKSGEGPVELVTDDLRETPSQVRLEFRFSVESNLGKELLSYVDSLKRSSDRHGSNLAIAHNLLKESENTLNATADNRNISVIFFQDFVKDPTRTLIEPSEKADREEIRKSLVALKDAKVLLVEDNEINQKIVLLSLKKRVTQIDVAANGKEALEMFGLKQYDLILMDIMMPVMDGITATKKMREIESTSNRHVPIIAITANALAGDRDNCLAAGADDYIAKPFQADVLIKKMKNLLA